MKINYYEIAQQIMLFKIIILSFFFLFFILFLLNFTLTAWFFVLL